jgi:hypothetical protein
MACALCAPSPALPNTYTVVMDASASWSSAKTAAALAGGYLAIISSATEQAAVEAAITAASPPNDGAFWIALRESTECCYVWDGGGATCFGHWYTAEPNNGAGGTPENRGQVMWNLSDASRRGYWNDVPDAGFPGTTDISRLGYVIEFGAPDPVPTCGYCVPVNPGSFCNTPPPGATVVKTKVTGTSTGPPSVVAGGKNERTIIDISPPQAGPSWSRPARVQAVYTVGLTVSSGVPALAVAAALIDSINHQVGPAGFVASFKSNTSDTVQMYRAVGGYTSNDDNGIPGITLTSYTYVQPASAVGSGLSGAGTAALVLLLLVLGAGAMWRRRRPTG